jgi:hypothetical protein
MESLIRVALCLRHFSVEFYVKKGGKWLLLDDLRAPDETKKQ